MMKRSRVEASYRRGEAGASIGPGQLVDVDALIPGSKIETYGDVFPSEFFDAVDDEPTDVPDED